MSSGEGFAGSGGAQPPGAAVPGVEAVAVLLGAGDQAAAAVGVGLSDFDLVAALAVAELAQSRAFAIRLRWIERLYQRPVMNPPQPSPGDPSGDGEPTRKRWRGLSRADLTIEEIRARLHLTPAKATGLFAMAIAVTTRLNATLAALWDGRLNEYKAQLVVELVKPMYDYEYAQQRRDGASPAEADRAATAKAHQVEERVLGRAGEQTPSAFRQCLRHAIAAAHPTYAATAARRARKTRKVFLRVDPPDGMAQISADLGAPEALTIYRLLDRDARTHREQGDERTLDQLRADLFTDRFLNPHKYTNPEANLTSQHTEHPSSDDGDASDDGSGNGSGSGNGNGSRTDHDQVRSDAGSKGPAADQHTEAAPVPPTDPHDARAHDTAPDGAGPHHTGAGHFEVDDAEPDDDLDADDLGGDDADYYFGVSGRVGYPNPEPETDDLHLGDPDHDVCDAADGDAQGQARGADPDANDDDNTDSAPAGHSDGDGDPRVTSASPPSAPSSGSRAQRRAQARGHRRKGRDRKPRHRCPRAHIQVTVSLDTLIGVSDEPGTLSGYGPINAELARSIALAPDSTWRRLVTDPLSGQLLDYGRTRYRAPKPLQDHVRARDVTCWHCGAPTDKCDLDHVLPYPYGETSARNLCCKCRRAHRLKHEGGWQDAASTNPNDPPGTFTATSPTGHQYTRQPPPIGPIHQTAGRPKRGDQTPDHQEPDAHEPAPKPETPQPKSELGPPPF